MNYDELQHIVVHLDQYHAAQTNLCGEIYENKLCVCVCLCIIQVLRLTELTEDSNYQTNKLRVKHRKPLLHILSQR